MNIQYSIMAKKEPKTLDGKVQKDLTGDGRKRINTGAKERLKEAGIGEGIKILKRK